MKKALLFLACTFMMAASMSLKAQEITFLLRPGWNWIGYPYPESVDLEDAFGDFEPMTDDVIESFWGYSEYVAGFGWFGGIDELKPGWGYMYYSNRTEAVTIVFSHPSTPVGSVTVTTSEPMLITGNSAMGGGNVVSNDGTYILVKGICWATHETPTSNDNYLEEGSGEGSFSATMTGLNFNTTYYYRAYAVTPSGTVYGEQQSFTTRDGIPTLTTMDITNITAISATSGGDITDNGGLNVTARGVCWSTSPNPTISDSHTTNGTGTGSFTSSITDLEINTTYYVRAYATTNAGTGYGNELTFNSGDGIPTVITAEVTNIQGETATCGGNVTDNCGLTVIARGVCWSTSPNPTLDDSHTMNGSGDGSFSSSIIGLTINTTYYVRAYASTSAGTGYGEQVSFTTRNGIPTMTTIEVINILGIVATSGGNITDDGGLAVIARGVCWSTSPNPTLADAHSSDGSGAGSFSSYITGLIMSTTYYVRAYATNSFVTVYGNQLSFTTTDDEHVYVDLGLPSGLLWATCNVGAVNPEDYGDYFAWGETSPKSAYDWDTYQYSNGGIYYYGHGDWPEFVPLLTKYCNNSGYGYNGFTDNLTTLLPEDDAATDNWGNGWRMPAEEEWQELYQNTTHTWTTQNGVNGRLFTASNGNSLFLPAAGYRYDSSNFYGAGSSGYYWSSSLNTGYPVHAWHLFFGSGYAHVSSGSDRSSGQSVRAVRCKNSVINVTVNPTEGGMVSGEGTYMDQTSCTVSVTANEGYTFMYWTENGEAVSTEPTYTFVVSGNRNLVANFAHAIGGHGYVDLGLPSGLLWATCNVGADNPVDYGYCFAWGETTPKDTYNWSTYQYCNGSGSTLTKYCNKSNYGYNGFTDNLTTLLPEDDVATTNWGSGWRMPTKEEWQELSNNTTVTWTTQNGVNGRLFTAANGNSLFLPAAGYRSGSSLYGAGSNDSYWSSSLDTNDPYGAWYFHFNSEDPSMNPLSRYLGQSVRPVRSSGQNTSFIIDATASPTEGGTVSGSGTYQDGTECTLTATPSENYTFTNWTENGEVVSTDAIYSFTVNADRTLVANFAVSGGDHAYVDLGLPSGTLWATCNVGADNPEDYGDYFAWGETQSKDIYNWSTYQYCNGSEYTMTKYCNDSDYGYNGFTDNLTTLLPEDDAATANWGSYWRMPTKEELQELYQNTTHTWTTQNGVNGRLFTASNGNSLFLPAAGYRSGSSLYDAGSVGVYWSSSFYMDDPANAWILHFISGGYSVDDNDRSQGRSVRAVRSSGQNTSL